jgi:DNA-binding transcriptional ArsR family regulator
MSEHGFDPAQDVLLDPRNMRGLAHPLRLRLLSLLRAEGPATATGLARRTGESSGSTSYHLRQLAAHGFIVDDDSAPRQGRERRWRAAHRATYFDGLTGIEEARAAGVAYLQAVATRYAQRITGAVDDLPELQTAGWDRLWDISDYRLALTQEQARELITELHRLGTRFRDLGDAGAPAGARRVALQFQVLPAADPAGDEARP